MKERLILESTDSENSTPLHLAASQGNAEMLETLLEYNPNLEAKDRDGHTPLHLAALSGHLEALTLLHKKGADLNTTDSDLLTPLHHAALKGHANIAVYLCESGVQVDAKNRSGWTPLLFAIAGYHLRVAVFLCQRGANLKVLNEKEEVFHRIVFHAIVENKTEIVSYLCELGFINRTTDLGGMTPLQLAKQLGKRNMKRLLQYSFRVEEWQQACKDRRLNFISKTLQKFLKEDNKKFLFWIVSPYPHPVQFFLQLFFIFKDNRDKYDDLLVKVLVALADDPMSDKLFSYGTIGKGPFDSILHGAIHFGYVGVIRTLIQKFRMDLQVKGPAVEAPFKSS